MRIATRLALLLTIQLGMAASLAVAQPGTLVVLNKAEGTAMLIDRESGALKATLPVGEGPHEVAVSHDGKRAFVCNYGSQTTPGKSISVLDLEDPKVIATWAFEKWTRPHGIAVSPGGTRLYITSETTQTLRVLDAETGAEIGSVPTKAQASHMVALAPALGRAFVSNIASNSISVIDIERLTLVRRVKTGAGPEGIAATPDGRELWIGNRSGDTLTVLNAQSLEPLATLEAVGFPIRVQITPDGRHALVSLAKEGALAIYSIAEKKEVARVAMTVEAKDAEGRFFGGQFGKSPVPIGIVITPDGKEAFVSCAQSDSILCVDLEKFTVTRSLKTGKEPDGVAFAPKIAAKTESEK